MKGSGWKRLHVRGAYKGTILASSKAKAELKIRVNRVGGVALIASATRGSSRVFVYAGRKRIAILKVPRATKGRVLKTVATPRNFTGTVRLVAKGRKGATRVDGIALVR